MSNDDPATKQDVEEIVGRVVGDIASNMMQLISERFDHLEGRMDTQEATGNRIENKLDATVVQVDDHELRLKHLEPKAA